MSRFQTVAINIAGGTGRSISKSLNSQSTKNFYPEMTEGGSSEQFVIHAFPGIKPFASVTSQFNVNLDDKGTHRMKEILYRVVGNVLYRVNSTGDHIHLGNIIDFSQSVNNTTIKDKCMFADDGENLFICYQNEFGGYKVVKWDSAIYSDSEPLSLYQIGGLTEVTDPNLANSESVCFLNNQFIYTKGKFYAVSDVGDGATGNGLNIAGAESLPDDIVRGYTFNQLLFLFGTRSTEIHFNSGVGSPPFERIEGRIFTVGLGAKFSVANNDNFLYWLGDDRKIYRSQGGENQLVSNIAVTNSIEAMEDFSDAIGFTFSFQNQNFYAITFVNEGITWCLSENLGADGWFELSSQINSVNDGNKTHGMYSCISATEAYGKTLMPLYNADLTPDIGFLNSLDINTFTGLESVEQPDETFSLVPVGIIRERTMAKISSDILGEKGKRLQMSRFELMVEKGVGLIDGQGEDPKIMIEASYDGGKTFSHATWMKIGRMGEDNLRAEWFSMKSFYSLIIRITTSDPVFYSIHSGTIDIRLAGR